MNLKSRELLGKEPDLRSKTKYINLDFARGMASVFVLLHHVRMIFFVDYKDLENPGLIGKIFYFNTGLGTYGVVVFFVLSGFLIIQNILNALKRNQWSGASYLIKRMARLWTVMIPTLVLTACWDTLGIRLTSEESYLRFFVEQLDTDLSGFWGFPPETIFLSSTFLQNIFFLQTVAGPAFGTNLPAWSLAYEFWYYMAFPLSYFLLTQPIAIFKKVVIFLVLVVLILFLPPQLLLWGVIWLLGYLAILGCNIEVIKNIGGTLTYFAGSVILFIILVVADKFKLIGDFEGKFAVAVGFLLMMPSLLFFRIDNITYTKISEFFSNISYTLYLTHYPILVFLCLVLNDGKRSPINEEGGILFCGLVAICIAYAFCIYNLFEKHTPKIRNLFLNYFNLK